MKKSWSAFCVLCILVLVLAAVPHPAKAGIEPDPPCTIDFYISNTLDVPVEYDVTNWTIGDLVHGIIDPAQEHRYSLSPSIFPPGYYEFFVTDQRTWDIFEWVDLPACSRVAIYIKMVKGQPVLKVKVILPDEQ